MADNEGVRINPAMLLVFAFSLAGAPGLARREIPCSGLTRSGAGVSFSSPP
jgi:hypothetical protein